MVSWSVRLRSVLFFIAYNLIGMVHSLLCLATAPFLDHRQRFHFVNHWTRATMWLLRHLNGVQVEVRGLDNIPDNEPVVVVANHQSQWETFYLQLLIAPQSTVLKRELLWVPFFGWGLALLRPIAINRRDRNNALKAVLRQGKARLDDGISVVIYPEGTRQPPGTLGQFSASGALLASLAGRRLLPIVHNAGHCWPARSMMRHPGTITLVIGPPIETEGKSAKQVNAEAERWIRQQAAALPGAKPSVNEKLAMP
ncbi:lysophospholipid acyltransferase family protein [Isoalcanivorax indicus]|uniref:lysophospholipid acyltransferase family protein n=1 Tax=Isoalcanivorax indicus TaxID=2202653 RepID=UPI000DBAAF36|nr:lysophospholipid acyltransferase family protein [Isoalcanivorax indicus]